MVEQAVQRGRRQIHVGDACASIASNTACGSKPGRMIWVAPNCSVASATGPAAWVSGATTRLTGASVRPPIALPTVSIIVPQPRLVTLTPLDGPVVPPVGKMPTISSQIAERDRSDPASASPSAPAMNSSMRRVAVMGLVEADEVAAASAPAPSARRRRRPCCCGRTASRSGRSSDRRHWRRSRCGC